MKYSVCKRLRDKMEYKGMINYHSLKEVLADAKPYDEIYLKDAYYYGKFEIKTPHLSIYGNNSIIDYDAYHGLLIRPVDGGDGIKTYGTTGSSTLTVKPGAENLYVEGLTIRNSYRRKVGDKHTQNVAFKTEAKNGRYFNCRFLGNQDTLYIDEDNNAFKECYIEGNVDFIFGRGDALIYDSTIKCLQILDSNAYVLAPSTFVTSNYGLVLYNSEILSEEGKERYLGRAWYPGEHIDKVRPRAFFKDVTMPSDMTMSLIQMHENDPINYVCYVKNCQKDEEIISNYDDKGLDEYYQKFINEMMF